MSKGNQQAVDSKIPASPCKCCWELWTPDSLNFHGLCDVCFDKFDHQKMKGRYKSTFDGEESNHFECAEEWARAQNHNNPTFETRKFPG